jgi:uncharacterized protein (DUF1330 family)
MAQGPRQSQTIAAYQAYLERFYETHKDMKEPTAVESALFDMKSVKHILTYVPRYWPDFGTVYLMKDGTVWETVMSGPRLMIVRFNNEMEWRCYQKPATIRQYHDQP